MKAQAHAEAESGFTVSGFNYLGPDMVCFFNFDDQNIAIKLKR